MVGVDDRFEEVEEDLLGGGKKLEENLEGRERKEQ